jgi:hypothetical protein
MIDEFFEHIVGVIASAGRAMERTPGTFAEGSEMQKRDVLLVMLNSHYQGAAAGEVFNGAGKADIVLRFADTKTIDGLVVASGAYDAAGYVLISVAAMPTRWQTLCSARVYGLSASDPMAR